MRHDQYEYTFMKTFMVPMIILLAAQYETVHVY